MAIRGGGLDRKSKAASEIPSSSLADIAFLLLIFFMVTTVFRTGSDRPIEWAEAEATQSVEGSSATASRSAMRPPVTAGPMGRAWKAAS